MAAFFKINELYRIAVEMERNRLAFYSEVASQTADEQTRAVYHYLASAEKRHLRTFKKKKSFLTELNARAYYIYYSRMAKVEEEHGANLQTVFDSLNKTGLTKGKTIGHSSLQMAQVMLPGQARGTQTKISIK